MVGNLDTNMSAYDLATNGGDLYTYDQVSNPNLIRQLDPATGHTLNSINIGTGYLQGEGGIAFRSDAVGFLSGGSYPNSYFLYTFTTSPGSAHLVSSEPVVFEGLAFSPTGVLYGLTKSALDPTGASRLMIIDQTTGALTLVGTTGYKLGYNDLGGLAFAPDGTLYCVVSNHNFGAYSSLFTLNASNAQPTFVGTVPEALSGIVFLNEQNAAAPEPQTFFLIGGGFLTALCLRRKSSDSPKA